MAASIKLTPSGIELFEGCPFLFRLVHVQRLKPSGPPRPSPQLSLGNSVHDCLYLFHKEGGYARHDRASIEALLRRSWISGGYSSEEEEREGWSVALRMCEGYHDAFAGEPVRHLGSELFLDSTLRVGEVSVLISGKLDRLAVWPDGHLEVVDYKTGDEAEPSPSKLAGKLTTFLYYVLARLNYREPPKVEVSYIYLRGMKKVTAVYDPALGADCKARLAEAVRQIAAGDFPARPNQRCAWCEYTDRCPVERPPEIDLDEVI